MKRWWASPEDSIAALSVVDDSDVMNGAGVAFLGYHGLAQSVLQPLTKETLVDTQRVSEVLSTVDLEPIAKALGEATRPVMGDASKRYGQLLAEEVHKRATVATERLLNTWTTNGMPWPQAIEKAAEVHGVPLERLGRYANVMKAVGMTALVRADYADRELMEYAADFGKRESITDTALIEKQQKRTFNEENHPRNPNGEFKDKNATVSSINEKLARINRINRINRISGVNRKTVETKDAKETKTKEKTVQLEQKDYGKKDYGKKNYGKKVYGVKSFTNLPPGGPKEQDFKKVENPYMWDKTVYVPLHAETFDNIKYSLGGEFFIGQLEKEGVQAISENEMEDWVNNYGGNRGISAGIKMMREDNLTLMRSTATLVDPETMDGSYSKGKVYDNLSEDTASAMIVPRSKYKVASGGGELLRIGTNNEMVYPTFLINLENQDFEDFSKNLNSSELREFNEDHPRDENGQFTNKNKVSDIDSKRAERIDRINRMNKINTQNRANQMKKLVDQQKAVQEKKDSFAEQKDYGQKVYGQKSYSKKDFGKVNWGKVEENIKPLPKPIELSDKLAMFIGMESTRKATDLNYWKDRIPDEIGRLAGSEDVDSPRPFNNPNLFAENTPRSLQESALEKIAEDADQFHILHSGRATREYLKQSGSKKYFSLDDYDLALRELFESAPDNFATNGLIWQPAIDDNTDGYGGRDDISAAWEANPVEDNIQILLGTKEEFESLKNGNATIEQVNGIDSLADLLMKSTNNGQTIDAEDTFTELFEIGLRNDVGTNPPVSAYTIKIGQNSKQEL